MSSNENGAPIESTTPTDPTENLDSDEMSEVSTEETASLSLAEQLTEKMAELSDGMTPSEFKEKAEEQAVVVDLTKQPFTPRSYAQWKKFSYLKENISFRYAVTLAVAFGRQVDIEADGLYLKDETVQADARCEGIFPGEPCPYNEKVFGYKMAIIDIKGGKAEYRVYRDGSVMHRGPARVVDSPDGTKSVVLNGEKCKSAITDGIRLGNEGKSQEERTSLPRWQSNEEASAFVARHNDWVAAEAAKKAEAQAVKDETLRRIANTFTPSTPRGKSRKEMQTRRGGRNEG